MDVVPHIGPSSGVQIAGQTRVAIISVVALILIALGVAHMFNVGDTSVVSAAKNLHGQIKKARGATPKPAKATV